MKYILYWEFDIKDFEIIAQKYANVPEELSGKSISENYTVPGETRGFQLIEVEDPLEISKIALYYAPEVDITAQPIIEAKQVMKAFQQTKT